jgi:hypothetical protein
MSSLYNLMEKYLKSHPSKYVIEAAIKEFIKERDNGPS